MILEINYQEFLKEAHIENHQKKKRMMTDMNIEVIEMFILLK